MSDEKGAEHLRIDLVKIRNVTRSSVSFRVPGQSIHLLPGQSAEVPKPYIRTAELEALCREGTIIEVPPAPRPAVGSRDQGSEREGEHAQGEAPPTGAGAKRAHRSKES